MMKIRRMRVRIYGVFSPSQTTGIRLSDMASRTNQNLEPCNHIEELLVDVTLVKTVKFSMEIRK